METYRVYQGSDTPINKQIRTGGWVAGAVFGVVLIERCTLLAPRVHHDDCRGPKQSDRACHHSTQCDPRQRRDHGSQTVEIPELFGHLHRLRARRCANWRP